MKIIPSRFPKILVVLVSIILAVLGGVRIWRSSIRHGEFIVGFVLHFGTNSAPPDSREAYLLTSASTQNVVDAGMRSLHTRPLIPNYDEKFPCFCIAGLEEPLSLRR